MHSKIAVVFAGMASLIVTSNAACVMSNELDELENPLEGVETREALCTVQADGNYQFGLIASEVSVPTFDGDNALAGVAGSHSFVLFNSKCVPVGAFAPEGNDCGIPYEIDYFPGKPLTVTSIDWAPSSPSFVFEFEGQSYRSREGKCGGCKEELDGTGLRSVGQCKCGFFVGSGPIDDPGTCVVLNAQSEPYDYAETDEAVCTPQADGNYQLTTETNAPTISLFDKDCHRQAVFRPDILGSDCRLPYRIEYFDGMDIMVTKLDADTGSGSFNGDGAPAFTFEFNGRSYGSRDDWCGGCAETKSGIDNGTGEQACRCGFYVGM